MTVLIGFFVFIVIVYIVVTYLQYFSSIYNI